MISSSRLRPSMEITLADIFQDYNDPRKELLTKRVALALEDQEKRMNSELDSNNLTNLQMMLKKQQIIKHLHAKIQEQEEQIEELNQQLAFSKLKTAELQTQLQRQLLIDTASQQKIAQMANALKDLEGVVTTKHSSQGSWQQQMAVLRDEVEKLTTDKQKLQQLIFSLRQSYSRKIEATECTLKIREKQMTQQFQQNIQQIRSSKLIAQQAIEVQEHFKNHKKNTKNQKVQCQIPDSSRASSNSPSPRPKTKRQAVEVQTDPTQQQTISIFIQKQDPVLTPLQNLDEVRLIYTQPSAARIASPKPLSPPPPSQPRYTTVFKMLTEDQESQTTPEVVKRYDRYVQVGSTNNEQALEEQIKKLNKQIKTEKMSQELKYNKLQQQHHLQQQNLRCMQQFTANMAQLQLQLQQKNQEIAQQRDLIARASQQLEHSQNQLVVQRLSGIAKTSPKLYSHTCRNALQNHRSSCPDSPNITAELSLAHNPDSVEVLSPRRWDEQEAELVTVIKHGSSPAHFKVRRRSVTQTQHMMVPQSSLLMKRKYQKYSLSKKK